MDITFLPPNRRGLPAFCLLLLFSAVLGSFPAGVRAANFVVSNTSDSGPGSLRAAINASNGSAGGNTIDVTGISGTITLVSGELTISSDVTISGPGADNLTVSGGFINSDSRLYSRVFNIAGSTTVGISGLTIAHGNSSNANDNPGYGGGLYNDGNLTLTNCTVADNTVSAAGSDTAIGRGGGLFSDGSLTLIGCLITENSVSARGTASFTNADEGGQSGEALSQGGGIFNDGGTLLVQDSVISGNGCGASNTTQTQNDGVFSFGGGICSPFGGTLTFINSTVSGNSATGTNANGSSDTEGGGIYEVGSVTTLTNCSLGGPDPSDGNTAQIGGAIRIITDLLTQAEPSVKPRLYACGPPILLSVDPTITGTTIQNNSAAQGGGLYLTGSSQISLLQDQILDNQATGNGGGIYDGSGNLVMDQTTISGNQAGASGMQSIPSVGYGGGLYNTGSTETITHSTFSGNTATAGGGLFASNGGSDTISSSTFTSNAASPISIQTSAAFSGVGGAVANAGSSISLTNCTLSGNDAVFGGGVYNDGDSRTRATVSLLNCTVSGNDADESGGGLFQDSTSTFQTSAPPNVFTVESSIVAQNTLDGTSASEQDVSAPATGIGFLSMGSNLIGNGDGGSGFTNGVTADQVGTTAAPLDPLLGPLQDNGGPTQTEALLSGSPAVDADFNGPNGQSTGDGVTVDQRGVARPQGARNDIGAYETGRPVAVNDAYSVPVNTVLTIVAPGVLDNDSGPAGHALTVVSGAPPVHGTLVLNADGSFTYTPVVNFTGTDTFTYQAQDAAQNSDPNSLSLPATVTITVQDTSPPTTTASLAGTLGNNSFYRGPVTVTLTATDPDTPAAQLTTFYTTDGSDPRTSATVTNVTGGSVIVPAISGDSAHTVKFYSRDPAGNTETPVKSVTFKIDATPPTLAYSPQTPAANVGGYNNTPVSIPYTPADNFSGVAGAAPGSPLTFTGEGRNQTRTVTVTDNAGNTATFTSPPVSIDLTPPVTTIVVNGPQASAKAVQKPQIGVITYTGPVTITLSAVDNLSGVATTTYTIDQGQAQPYTQPFVVSASGTHVVTFRSTDNAGNAETAQTLTFTISPPVTQQILHTFPTGLYLFSVPKDMTGIPLSQTFDQPSIKLAVWLPQIVQYVLTPTPPCEALRPGQGYWARFGQNTNLYDLGTPTPTNAPFAIPIHVGWNMIGDPFPSPASPSSLRVQTSTGVFTLGDSVSKILLSPTLYSYDTPSGQYQAHALQSDSLTPYVGYWLYSRCEGNLLVNVP